MYLYIPTPKKDPERLATIRRLFMVHDAQNLNEIARLRGALKELTDWARENTSPRDPNSPHEILVRAVEILGERK